MQPRNLARLIAGQNLAAHFVYANLGRNGLSRERIVAREHDKLHVHLLKQAYGLNGVRLYCIRHGEKRRQLAVRSHVYGRFALRAQRCRLFLQRVVYALLAHKPCAAHNYVRPVHGAVHAVPRAGLEALRIGHGYAALLRRGKYSLGKGMRALLFSRRRKISFWALADCCVQGLFIGQAIGRWGNFMNREAFGAATELPWRMRLWTSATTYMDVLPSVLNESLWNVIGLLLLYFVVSRARRFDGENTCFYFIWYGLGRFWIEGLRTDSLYLFHWTLFGQRIRVSQALSLVMVLVCAGILVYQFKVKKADGSNLFVKRMQQTTEAEEAAAEPTAPDEKK